jgi:membrane protein
VLLVWVYYSAQIILLGAEFTREYVKEFGHRPPPSEFATKDPAPPLKPVGGRKRGKTAS